MRHRGPARNSIVAAGLGVTEAITSALHRTYLASHIVLFDFIEEKHAEGEPFEQAVLDAGIVRLRPAMITVGATVFGLIPLAAHGGPRWEPLCYAQIGGLTAATFIALLLVPVFSAICGLDLKIVKWDRPAANDSEPVIKEAERHREAVLR